MDSEEKPVTPTPSDTGEAIPRKIIVKKYEKRLLLKLDAVFVPIIMLVYLSCFLDRTNISNVKVAGMPEDIGASDAEFSTAVKLTPRVVLTGLCVVWSLTTIFSGFITSVEGLHAARLILGACEGGLFPGLNLYLTMVCKREEQARRGPYLFVCAALSGAFGGLLAYVLLKMNNIGGYAGWRWVYIIEGIFSILIGLLIWFGLPNDPTNAQEEIRISLKDFKLWISGAIQFCQDILWYGFSTFLPSIITNMGHSSIEAQYLTIPVYILGGACFLTLAFVSDHMCIRGPFIAFANIFGIVGYILIICPTSNAIKFFGTFLCAVAVYSGPGLNLTWLNVNVAPHYRRAASIGFQQTIGNTAGIVAGQVYRTSPYLLGNVFSVSALGLAQLLILFTWLYIRRCNLLKEQIATGQVQDKRRVKTGDWELDFKYHL
ncbi:major facilitator superfamily domain-containing protein [Cercophora samala]|uniref:Major facilitator superfamily domain-containing protein n=1 Tax=Cercophora samala TaxID=330535 RepID=A0AA40D9R3_9PEZI|nr:major facilitator superfamily domain-containing protein [Cercophora samala]